MKIALIGNMNNNFFSIMRYLRDLGMDANLFMYEKEYAHFKPEKDTHSIDLYKDFIHILSVKQSVKGLLFLDVKKIKNELKEYDFFIGCGIAPAMFLKLNIRLDIFMPHDISFEHTLNPKILPNRFFTALSRKYVVSQQIKGIQTNTTKVLASHILKITRDSIKRLKISDKIIKKYLLMVYLEESETIKLKPIIEKMMSKDLVLFSHTRHIWQKETMVEDYVKKEGGKGLNKLIIGYAQFIKKMNSKTKPLLVFFEYGQDVEGSKALITEFGIEEYILWLPLMERKNILQLIDYSDIVVDSLSSAMWSGVGWEGLSRGKIIMQNIIQSDEEFEKVMGHKLPFIMKANKADDVEMYLHDFLNNRELYLQREDENKQWFDKYAGVGLAKEYQQVIEKIYSEKMR